MTPTLILWDIDGTLLRGGGVGKRAMEAAFREVMSELAAPAVATLDLASVPFHGNTDPAIIAAGLALLEQLPSVELIDAIARSYLIALHAEVLREPPFRRLPGALEAVDALARAGTHQGLGTGNLEAAAWLKVAAIDLAGRFSFGGFGSDAADRAELLRIGRDRGAGQLGVAVGSCRVVVIGDTLRDIAAARAIGADIIAVATGGDSLATLQAASPDLLFETLAAPEITTSVAAFATRAR